MFKRKGGKRTQRKRGNRRKIRIPKSRLGLNPATQNRNYATITETYKSATTLNANQSYFFSISIASFTRAKAVAACFKFYRLKAVVFDYVPDANTYQAGVNATTETVPYMYYMMNRDGSDRTGQTLAGLQQAGARPIKFTKKIVIAYKPNLLKANQLIVSLIPNTSLYNGNNVPVYDEWVSTAGLQFGGPNNWTGTTDALPLAAQGNVANPLELPDMVNVLPYYGHVVYFDQANSPPGSTAVGTVSYSCIWEFKEPVLFPAGSSVNEEVTRTIS